MANIADLIIAHHFLPQAYSGAVAGLHMKPEKIGQIVSESKAYTLVLSHFLERTEEQINTKVDLQKYFGGEISFASDFNCYAI